jgi:hypothetical protein
MPWMRLSQFISSTAASISASAASMQMTRVTPGGTTQVILDVKVMKFSGWAAAIPFDNGEDASIIHNSARRIGFLPSLFLIWPKINIFAGLIATGNSNCTRLEATIIR